MQLEVTVKDDPHFSLLALIKRRRGELSTGEAFFILRELPEILDSLNENFVATEPLVNRIIIQFPGLARDYAMEGILDAKASSWPSFRLTLRSAGGSSSLGKTDFVAPSKYGNSKAAHFALLICEMIGGGRRDAIGGAEFSPLAALSEEGNDLLRSALDGKGDVSILEFWANLLRISKLSFSAANRAPEPRRATAKVGPPPAPAKAAAPFDEGAFELEAIDGDKAIIRFSSRKTFKIGRSAMLADYPIRSANQMDKKPDLVSPLSRVQVLLENGPHGVTIRDGDGTKASANGSTLGGQRLKSTQGRLLFQREILLMAGCCRLEVAPVILTREARAELEELPKEGVSGEHRIKQIAGIDSVFINPMDEDSNGLRAVWLLNEIPFKLNAGGGLAWTEDVAEMAGAFCFRDGGFSIRTGLREGQLVVDGGDLGAGEQKILEKGTRLKIGGRHFRCRAIQSPSR
jgi:hypothetical protein